MRLSLALGLAALLATAASTHAVIVQPTAYAMPNGYGQGAGGSFNYWDLSYTGTGNTTQDGAPLSGGLGDLTDGIITTENWNNVENVSGTGPYVGWNNINPVLTFSFAAPTVFDLVRVHFDDSRFGGVALPLSVDVTIAGNTTNYPLDQGTSTAPRWVDLPISATAASSVQLTINRRDVWSFADEVQFSAIPEPTGTTLMSALAAASLLRRHKR